MSKEKQSNADGDSVSAAWGKEESLAITYMNLIVDFPLKN